MKIIVLHEIYENKPVIIKIDAISGIIKRNYQVKDSFEEYTTVFVQSFSFDVNEHVEDILTKIEIAESMGNNKKSYNTALRVYDETSGSDICGNCLGYINRDFDYCPKCGARLEG